MHDTHGAGTDLLPDGTPFHQHGALALEFVAVFGLAGALALDRFRAGLQDVQLAVQPVFAPLDIHGAPIVFFDHQRIGSQFFDIRIAQRITVAHFGRHIGGFNQLSLQRAVRRFFIGRGELHLNEFGAQAATNQRPLAQTQHGLVHVKLVRVHGALNHGFAQTIAGGDEHHVFKAGFGINGEHHARGTQVRAHHALNTGAQGHMLMRKAFVHPIADGAVVVKRRKDLPDLVQDGLDANHVQERLLLACKRRIGQILCSS